MPELEGKVQSGQGFILGAFFNRFFVPPFSSCLLAMACALIGPRESFEGTIVLPQ